MRWQPAVTSISPFCGAFARRESAFPPIPPTSSWRQRRRSRDEDRLMRRDREAGPKRGRVRRPAYTVWRCLLRSVGRADDSMHQRPAFLILTALALAACAGEPDSQPSFYRSLATPDAEVDAGAAQSM